MDWIINVCYKLNVRNVDSVIFNFFDHSKHLQIDQAQYRKALKSLFLWLLNNDKINKDVTTSLLFGKGGGSIVTANIVARKEMVVCGVAEIKYFLHTFTHIKCSKMQKDGKRVKDNQSILTLSAEPSEILTYERTILNILQRLSGIATATYEKVGFINSLVLKRAPFILSTRKTTWGVFDKKAVAIGGGLTHRLNLSDGVLVKDNHLLILKRLYKLESEKEMVLKALELANAKVNNTLIEIEVETEESIAPLLHSFQLINKGNVLGILFDNFSPQNAKRILKDIQRYDLSNVVFEASGGINDNNLAQWATTGVDLISIGALTHSVKAADISLEID